MKKKICKPCPSTQKVDASLCGIEDAPLVETRPQDWCVILVCEKISSSIGAAEVEAFRIAWTANRGEAEERKRSWKGGD